MNWNSKFINPIGFLVGIITGMVFGLAIGNLWVGLGSGVVLGFLISPVYSDNKRVGRIKSVYTFVLLAAIAIAVIAALAILLSSI